ncbi:MAG: tetratricopeptide repeat protein [Xanthomonadales bacterium]|nr:tetratricopeptide repeat protein [Xanthomonadales bacterium]
MKQPSNTNPISALDAQVKSLLIQGHVHDADQLLSKQPELPPGLLILHSQVAQKLADFPRMLALAQAAHKMDPHNDSLSLRVLECQIYAGQTRKALTGLDKLQRRASKNSGLLHRIANLYVHCARHQKAYECHAQALRAQPDNPDCKYDLATSCIAAGEFDQAEQLLEEVIRQQPSNWTAWQNRSNLRKQTRESNHVGELKAALNNEARPGADEVPLNYALAKEYEDLGDYRRAVKHLATGAARRRQQLSYRVNEDVATMRRIRSVFSQEFIEQAKMARPHDGPVFVLGMPRSGTTLVDRIISSHSRVSSLGEVNNLSFAVIGASGFARDKESLVEQSSRADFEALGQTYLEGTRGLGEAGPLLIDKTPLNFLYLGIIYLALPGARVIHLRRHPMDSCFAMYKTLFRAGYPFSYDLDDLGTYYVAYRRLMAHWRQVLPGFIHDVSYEDLVKQQEATSRSMLEFCGLDWEEQVLDFHRNRGAAATASAAQVRQPIYSSSVGRWRYFESHLEPLRNKLILNGIYLD